MDHNRNRPTYRSWSVGVIAVAATLIASACGSATITTSSTPSSLATETTKLTIATSPLPTPETAAATTTLAGAQAKGLIVTEADKGTTTEAHVGDHITVTLSSTYWMIDETSGAGVLHEDSPPIVAPKVAGCVPGAGCGTVTATFTAATAGTATIKASRTTCGEALLCTGDNGNYQVTVNVA